MKIAAAIVTERGGLTCHAAIVARELGLRRGGDCLVR
jgi:phosphoenolpyruvate synthase/pyruvate phosphate dikinase